MEKRKKAAPKTTHSLNTHDKGNGSQAQYQIVYQSFKEHPKTMLDVSLETGILRANICRYVADMEDKGLIQLLYKTGDEHTKFTAGYYSTDESLFDKADNRQLKLFEEGE
jgi:DNA-binding transcriptional regulator GbsR (MarR family)